LALVVNKRGLESTPLEGEEVPVNLVNLPPIEMTNARLDMSSQETKRLEPSIIQPPIQSSDLSCSYSCPDILEIQLQIYVMKYGLGLKSIKNF
jgi:hypothetical protein